MVFQICWGHFSMNWIRGPYFYVLTLPFPRASKTLKYSWKTEEKRVWKALFLITPTQKWHSLRQLTFHWQDLDGGGAGTCSPGRPTSSNNLIQRNHLLTNIRHFVASYLLLNCMLYYFFHLPNSDHGQQPKYLLSVSSTHTVKGTFFCTKTSTWGFFS